MADQQAHAANAAAKQAPQLPEGAMKMVFSPAQLSFKTMMEILRMQMKRENTMTELDVASQKIFGGTGQKDKDGNIDTGIIGAGADAALKAGKDNAAKTRLEAGEMISGAVGQVVGIAGSFVGSKDFNTADENVKSLTKLKDGVSAIDKSGADVEMGELGQHGAGETALHALENSDLTQYKDGVNSVIRRPNGSTINGPNGKPLTIKDVYESMNTPQRKAFTKRVNDDLKMQQGNRQTAATQRETTQRTCQMGGQLASGVANTTLKFFEADKAKDIGQDNANSSYADGGKRIIGDVQGSQRDQASKAKQDGDAVFQILMQLQRSQTN